MKGLQEILDAAIKKLPSDVSVFVNDDANWNVYCSISGYINDDYFDIYFKHHKKSVSNIEIARTTKNPKYFIRLIKKIDKSIEINYTEITTTYKECTV